MNCTYYWCSCQHPPPVSVKRTHPWNRKQAACFRSPPLVRGFIRETTIFTSDGLICGHNNIILLQDLCGPITARTIVYCVTQRVGHAMVLDLLFPVRKYRERDHCNEISHDVGRIRKNPPISVLLLYFEGMSFFVAKIRAIIVRVFPCMKRMRPICVGRWDN